MPYWVGKVNGSSSARARTSTSTSTSANKKTPSSTLSEGGVQYHVNYLLGAKRYHNISFNWVGIWNESPWTKVGATSIYGTSLPECARKRERGRGEAPLSVFLSRRLMLLYFLY